MPHAHNAERMFRRIQQHIDEGNASEYSIGVLKSLKSSRDTIMDNLVDAEMIGIGTVLFPSALDFNPHAISQS